MGDYQSRPVVRSGSIGSIFPSYNDASRKYPIANATLAGFLKNKLTGSLYGLTAGTRMKQGYSFCIAISRTHNLPDELVQYAREVNECKFIEIGRCILQIDDIDVKLFRPSNDYTNKTSVALIEIHDQLRQYFVLDLRDTDGEAMTVNIRDPTENLEVYYKYDDFRQACDIVNVNTGVFSVRETSSHDQIMPKHVGGLIQRDDTDQQTSVYGMLLTIVEDIYGLVIGWALPMRIILQRLKEALGFEVMFFQPPHRKAPLQIVQEAYRAFRSGLSSSPLLGPNNMADAGYPATNIGYRAADMYDSRVNRYCFVIGQTFPLLYIVFLFFIAIGIELRSLFNI